MHGSPRLGGGDQRRVGTITGGSLNCVLRPGSAIGTCSTLVDYGSDLTMTLTPAASTQANANWTGGKPTSSENGGTVVQFNAGSTSIMDIANLVVDQIVFTGNNNAIGGTSGIKLTISSSVLFAAVLSPSSICIKWLCARRRG